MHSTDDHVKYLYRIHKKVQHLILMGFSMTNASKELVKSCFRKSTTGWNHRTENAYSG
ncbi:predicted protein [Histoplasma mississippiense (nom. inval.)]|uniref:predicted protein n=1 Tax=Ajellomyces capsulatus (strain NAm1 / WU24) TaxID=2059318 RepID=UPI000157C04C|nr:predicted protein [Histoplasma mississippiense (nom. inval.)]EDN07077.1 predicted protein [Histoplasma mississippiense (nom. inval.)]